jgi:aspartyl-tRNA(Asn)/glutamyl-tRNA(Gln) amidotransferase subunit A
VHERPIDAPRRWNESLNMPLPAHTIANWREQLVAGRCTARELIEKALETAIHGSEARTTFLAVHAEAARASAEAIDLQRKAGRQLPALAGIPVSIKDLFDEAGQITRAGSRVLADAAPASADAPVVSRLRAAGAIVVGRTNMTEFAYSGLGLNPHYGTPRNPWDRVEGRIPGGSSSGAAISVTDGMAVAAIGTDTGGSVRIPSALCGLTGFKPTAARVPADGCLPLSPTLDSIGPLARSVACCAELDAVLAGEAYVPISPAGLEGRRFALPRTQAFEGTDAAVMTAFEGARRRLEAAGAVFVDLDIPEFDELGSINRTGGFIAAEAWKWHADLIARREPDYDPRVATRIRRGAAISPAEYAALQAERLRWIAAVGARLRDIDALLMPTVPVVAPRIADVGATDEAYSSANLLMLRNPTFINFLDGCALSLPCHRPGDAPVGLMVAGTAGADRHVLAIGAGIEKVLSRS